VAPVPGTTAPTPQTGPAVSPTSDPSGYTVIARRYRPQRFEDVVGQDHVVQALRNAIRLNRVTHAYLFTGTRGVGKTSVARIFAKCLNCVHGPTEEPCQVCDICQSIAVGQDVDVIEIDGASNNGVESVRDLRQKVGVRPGRARYKIYYIDEVHMLSTGAFNALLKTLEEPPPNVKFFFATTEPDKIPETVRSRCQRYDFAGISPEQVVETLAAICRRERVEAEVEALRAVARRASGSMRDAQSLLEQIMPPGGEALTLELVHRRLGTASDERVLDLLDALAGRDPGAALTLVDRAAAAGVQPVDLLNGLLEFLRDVMVLAAGAGDELLLAATPRETPRLRRLVERWPLDTVLTALQILAETRGRLRGSPHTRLLVEMAMVKVARLERLGELSELVARLAALETGSALPSPEPLRGLPGGLAPPVVNAVGDPQQQPDEPERPVAEIGSEPHSRTPPPQSPVVNAKRGVVAPPLDLEEVRKVWPELIRKVGMRLGVPLDRASEFLAISGPNTLAARLPAGYTGTAGECDNPEARATIQRVLSSLLGRPVEFVVQRAASRPESGPELTPRDGKKPPATARIDDPMVKKLEELFEAKLMFRDDDDETRSSPPR